MFGIPYDDMIENLDFEKLACTRQVARDLDVSFRRGRVPARMVVSQHDGGRGGHYCQAEAFAGVDEDGVERAD